MVLTLVTLALGIAVGMSIRNEQIIDRYNKNFDQIDRDIRTELELNRNLVKSYKQDIERLKQQIQRLKDEKY
jgi:uncharacterized protein YdcH (DUF465 family)